MRLIRWDRDSAWRAAAGLVCVLVPGYGLATHPMTDENHLGLLIVIILGFWVMITAFVPVLRAEPGTPHRTLLLIGQGAVVVALVVIAWGATH